MRTKKISIAAMASIVVLAAWNLSLSAPQEDNSDLALANVEALASGEGGTPVYTCYSLTDYHGTLVYGYKCNVATTDHMIYPCWGLRHSFYGGPSSLCTH